MGGNRRRATTPGLRSDVRPSSVPAKGWFRRLPRRVQLLVVAPLAIGSAAAATIAAGIIYYTIVFPDPLSLRSTERTSVVRVLARDGTSIGSRGAAQDYIPLDLLPRLVIDAVVATEDRRFNEHWGLDPIGLLRASFANLREGRFAQGGSTLTQQLAKNLFLTPERTMARKLEELVLALWLEFRLSKTEILELYLNRVYFGGGAYGIEAAAQRYFDKSARELSVAEAAVIAGLLKAPSKYSPASNPGAARQRGRTVLGKMRDAGVISELQEKAARAEVVQFVGTRRSGDTAGAEYVVDYVLEQLPGLIGSGHPDVIVETTIDDDLQRRASEVVRKELVLQGSLVSADQAAAVVLDLDGGIRALVGGRSYADSQFNRAVKARRQPGSTFKPFVYLAALESGLNPDSVAYDLPISANGWTPHNENGKYTGAVTLRHALAHSINTVAARLILELGPKRVSNVARRLGIRSPLREGPALALGASEVSLLELTGAYDAFANGGRSVEPYVIRRVRQASGRVLYARTAPDAKRGIAPQQVAGMNDMLHEVMVRGTGRRAALPLHPAAGKTGTSQDFRDAWFVGYTASFAAGVWVGNDKGTAMNKVRGGQLPADIWRQIMVSAHAGKTPQALHGTDPRTEVEQMQGALNAPGAELSLPAALPPLARSQGADSSYRTSAPPSVVQHLYPTDRIDEGFVARMLDGEDMAEQEDDPPPQRLRSDVGWKKRIIVRPPPAGMMSLGSGLPVDDGDRRQQADDSCGFWSYVTGC